MKTVILRVEKLYMANAFFGLCTTIKTQTFPPHYFEETLHNIHGLRHLEKDENLTGDWPCVTEVQLVVHTCGPLQGTWEESEKATHFYRRSKQGYKLVVDETGRVDLEAVCAEEFSPLNNAPVMR